MPIVNAQFGSGLMGLSPGFQSLGDAAVRYFSPEGVAWSQQRQDPTFWWNPVADDWYNRTPRSIREEYIQGFTDPRTKELLFYPGGQPPEPPAPPPQAPRAPTEVMMGSGIPRESPWLELLYNFIIGGQTPQFSQGPPPMQPAPLAPPRMEQGGYISPQMAELVELLNLDRGEVPIVAHQGEFVLNKKATDAIGPQTLESINEAAKQLPRFQQGGFVGPMSPAAAPHLMYQMLHQDALQGPMFQAQLAAGQQARSRREAEQDAMFSHGPVIESLQPQADRVIDPINFQRFTTEQLIELYRNMQERNDEPGMRAVDTELRRRQEEERAAAPQPPPGAAPMTREWAVENFGHLPHMPRELSGEVAPPRAGQHGPRTPEGVQQLQDALVHGIPPMTADDVRASGKTKHPAMDLAPRQTPQPFLREPYFPDGQPPSPAPPTDPQAPMPSPHPSPDVRSIGGSVPIQQPAPQEAAPQDQFVHRGAFSPMPVDWQRVAQMDSGEAMDYLQRIANTQMERPLDRLREGSQYRTAMDRLTGKWGTMLAGEAQQLENRFKDATSEDRVRIARYEASRLAQQDPFWGRVTEANVNLTEAKVVEAMANAAFAQARAEGSLDILAMMTPDQVVALANAGTDLRRKVITDFKNSMEAATALYESNKNDANRDLMFKRTLYYLFAEGTLDPMQATDEEIMSMIRRDRPILRDRVISKETIDEVRSDFTSTVMPRLRVAESIQHGLPGAFGSLFGPQNQMGGGLEVLQQALEEMNRTSSGQTRGF